MGLSVNDRFQGTYEICVLGCKVNQYDAQQIRCVLEQAGFRRGGKEERVSVAVVHSCAVTAEAARKSRRTIRRMRSKHPGAYLILSGCLASDDSYAGPLDAQIRVPPGPGWLGRFARGIEALPGVSCPVSLPGDPDSLALDRFAGHTRAFLKIQDGCHIGCSYCIVPRLRRAPRDKDLPLILEEARRLVESGHREIVVSGVSVGLYGGGRAVSLADVMRALVDLPGTERLRLSSLHPAELTDKLLEVWGASPKMMPHIHLPLQSGSDRILAAMRRGYGVSEFLNAVERVRAVMDKPACTTDVIVGFPGETDEDFRCTLDVCRAVGFSRVHVFPYSVRPGTAAARSGRVSRDVVAERSAVLRATGRDLARAYHERFLGETVRVLIERRRNGTGEGYTEQYIPASVAEGGHDGNGILEVRVVQADAEGVRGHPGVGAAGTS